MIYRVYMSDLLRTVCENTAKISGGSYMRARYCDIIHPKPEETRTADEIIAHVTSKLKGGARE